MNLGDLISQSIDQGHQENSFPDNVSNLLTDPILSRIGDTQLIKYDGFSSNANIRIKCEFDNPTGSMKDRIAYGMIAQKYLDDHLCEGDLIVEASSGNTAGSIAFVASRLDHEAIITVPEGTSSQKIGFVTAFGAELVKCPNVSKEDDRYYRNQARQIAKDRDGVWLDQYTNQINPTVHAQWTGPEITRQYPDLTHIVAPMGTGGTMSGIAKHVKSYDDSIITVGVDADQSNISSAYSGTEFGPYETNIEGLGKERELPTMWFEYIDEIQSVDDKSAFLHSRRAAQDAGILIGASSGAALVVAREIAKNNPNAEIAVIACDSGKQYFDTIFNDAWMEEQGYPLG